MTYFRIKQRDFDGMWVPADPMVEWLAAHADDATPHEEKRAALFIPVNDIYPGIFSLEWDLAELKQERIAEINQRTVDILGAGFLYQSQRYSTSHSAETLYLNIKVSGVTAATINNHDDTSDTTFTSTALTTFLTSALGFIRSTIDTGTQLKRQIRNATTVEAALAVTDTR